MTPITGQICSLVFGLWGEGNGMNQQDYVGQIRGGEFGGIAFWEKSERLTRWILRWLLDISKDVKWATELCQKLRD